MALNNTITVFILFTNVCVFGLKAAKIRFAVKITHLVLLNIK